MILKFQHNMRINSDGNISISSETIVDSPSEAEEAGKEFAILMAAFMKGYGEQAAELNE